MCYPEARLNFSIVFAHRPPMRCAAHARVFLRMNENARQSCCLLETGSIGFCLDWTCSGTWTTTAEFTASCLPGCNGFLFCLKFLSGHALSALAVLAQRRAAGDQSRK